MRETEYKIHSEVDGWVDVVYDDEEKAKELKQWYEDKYGHEHTIEEIDL